MILLAFIEDHGIFLIAISFWFTPPRRYHTLQIDFWLMIDTISCFRSLHPYWSRISDYINAQKKLLDRTHVL